MFKKEPTNTQNKSYEMNKIAKGTLISGDITSAGDFRIDGTLEGVLTLEGRVVIGTKGQVKGSITCTNADIEGIFSGDLKVTDTLTIKTTANISGDVVIGKLSVEPGATFNATCAMKSGIKELKNEQKKPVAS